VKSTHKKKTEKNACKILQPAKSLYISWACHAIDAMTLETHLLSNSEQILLFARYNNEYLKKTNY